MSTLISKLLSGISSCRTRVVAAETTATAAKLPTYKYKRIKDYYSKSINYYIAVYIALILLFDAFTNHNLVECRGGEGSFPLARTHSWTGEIGRAHV